MSRGVWVVCALATISGGVAGLYPMEPHPGFWIAVCYNSRHLIVAAAYLLALAFSIKIQSDYPGGSRMRVAWTLISGSCAVAVLRYLFDWSIGIWKNRMTPDLISLRQIPIALTLVLLTAGLAVMWSSFAALGLGARFRKLDLLGFSATVACVPFVFSLREGMADSHSAYALIRYVQSASPILLAAPALGALALHRISHEMGQSTLAVSLRLLAVSLITRLISLWISSALGRDPFFSVLALGLHAAAAWIFLQAVLKRWSLTLQAASLAERYQRDPARELAELSERLATR